MGFEVGFHLGVVNLNSLLTISGNILFTSSKGTLSVPALKSIGGSIIFNSSNFATLSADALQFAGNILITGGYPTFSAAKLTTCASLNLYSIGTETFRLPSLTAVKGSLSIARVAVGSWSFPSLTTVSGSLVFQDSVPGVSGASVVDFSKLQTVQGTLTITGNANPYTVPTQHTYDKVPSMPCFYGSRGELCKGKISISKGVLSIQFACC
jgi:hypothetical protein